MAGWPKWATAHFKGSIVTEKVCRDRASWMLCRDRLFLAATGCVGQVHDQACVRTIGLHGRRDARATAQRARTTEILNSVSRQKLCVATGLGLGLDDQGRDRVPLGTGSRLGIMSRARRAKDRRPCVATWNRCRDKGLSLLCRDGEFSIATEDLRKSVAAESFVSRQQYFSVELKSVTTRLAVWCRDKAWLAGPCHDRARSARDRARSVRDSAHSLARCARQHVHYALTVQTVKPQENSIFLKNGKMVISIKI